MSGAGDLKAENAEAIIMNLNRLVKCDVGYFCRFEQHRLLAVVVFRFVGVGPYAQSWHSLAKNRLLQTMEP